MLNKIIMMGRLVTDPELKTIGEFTVTNFRIACDRDYVDKDGIRSADFINVQAWGKTGEFVMKHFAKGDLIAIEGRLESYEYQKDRKSMYGVQLKATSVYFTGSNNKKAVNDNSYSQLEIDKIKFPGEE